MFLRQSHGNQTKPIRSSAMNYSSSVSSIIHGDSNAHCNHYIDALERFKRDFATSDKEERALKRKVREQKDERRRNEGLIREAKVKHNEQQNLNKLMSKQHESKMMHLVGFKRTAHTLGVADNIRGDQQAYLDEQIQIKHAVRAHKLQKNGTSGFNVINGAESYHVDHQLSSPAHEDFEKKLNSFYEKFNLKKTDYLRY